MTTVNERNVADKLMNTDDMKSAFSHTTAWTQNKIKHWKALTEIHTTLSAKLSNLKNTNLEEML